MPDVSVWADFGSGAIEGIALGLSTAVVALAVAGAYAKSYGLRQRSPKQRPRG